MLINLYSSILDLLFCGLAPLVSHTKFGRRYRLLERTRLPELLLPLKNRSTVWIHGASLGECKLLIQVLRHLRQKDPDQLFVLTAMTDTGVAYLTAHRDAGIAAVGFLPGDSIRLMKRMLRSFAVSRLWILETELWPGLLRACLESQVPVGIINGRMEKESVAGYRRFLPFLMPLFRHLAPVLVQSEEYAARFRSVGVKAEVITVTGNLKSAVSIEPIDPARRQQLRSCLGIGHDELVVTAGCIHPGESAVIAEAAVLLEKKGISCRWVVVPRHREATPLLKDELGADALVVTELETTVPWKICLVDRYGVLDDLYAMANLAFLGGTLVSVGGHNPWDPIRWGTPFILGPQYHTQKESCDHLIAAGVAFSAANGKEIAGLVERLSGPDASALAKSMIILADELNIESSAMLNALGR